MRGTAVGTLLFSLVLAFFVVPDDAAAELNDPFAGLAGRWVGEGRLGFKDGKFEEVKCRATYFVSDNAHELKQNIRCASAGGKVEVQATVTHQGDVLSGTWSELIYNITGDLSGKITPHGYDLAVRSRDLAANMQILVKDARQIVEIQFHHATLVGLTLLLRKG